MKTTQYVNIVVAPTLWFVLTAIDSRSFPVLFGRGAKESETPIF